jgi:hypothetical protein
MADRALMKNSKGRFGPVYTHMCFEIAFGSERSTAYFAFKGSFAGVGAVVHL